MARQQRNSSRGKALPNQIRIGLVALAFLCVGSHVWHLERLWRVEESSSSSSTTTRLMMAGGEDLPTTSYHALINDNNNVVNDNQTQDTTTTSPRIMASSPEEEAAAATTLPTTRVKQQRMMDHMPTINVDPFDDVIQEDETSIRRWGCTPRNETPFIFVHIGKVGYVLSLSSYR
jgi:hypothetical protein